MNFPPSTATDEQWSAWLKWARENPGSLHHELRRLLGMYDDMAIQLAKLWRTVNRR